MQQTKLVKEMKWVQGDQIADGCPGTLEEENLFGPQNKDYFP